MKPEEFKVDKYALRWNRPDLTPRVSDFLRYTFQPSRSILLLIAALVAMTCIVVCAMTERTFLTIAIFCTWLGFFSTTVLVSYYTWKRYKNF